MSLTIRTYGDPVLREESQEVETFDGELRDFAGHMVESLREEHGLGLAAPQVGALDRVVVIDRSFGETDEEMWVLVNPEILASEGACSFEEGCLSVPGIWEDVVRPERVRLRYRDLEGAEHVIDADGVLARVIQHEADHLNGVLFVDRLGLVKRQFLARSLKDLARNDTEG